MRGRSVRRRAAGLAAAVALLALPAFAGEITGTVRGPDGLPRQGSAVQAYEAATGILRGGMTTGANGVYTISALAAGNYFVQAEPPSPSAERLTGELYSGIRQNEICGARGTEVAVGAGTTMGVDFALRVGVTIRGHVAPWNPPPISPISSVVAYDARGCAARATGIIGGDGSYTVDGLPPGRYYLIADFGGGQVDQLYPDLPCVARQCDVTRGTPVATGTTNADFAVQDGGAIAGTITGPGGSALAGVEVSAWKGGEKLASVITDGTGGYFLNGLPVANGYRVLALRSGVVSEVYPDAPCPAGGCSVGASGSAIDIPSAGTVVSGKDLQLAVGHAIAGTLAPAGSAITVEVFGSSGLAGRVVGVNSYSVPDLPNGDYVVRATSANGLTELWNNQACPANQFCIGDPVHVAGANVGAINFTLALGRGIAGTVRNTSGDPIAGVPIEVSAADGTLMSRATTLLDGSYRTESEGLPPGSYFVRTRLPLRLHRFVDQLWSGRPCGPGCVPASGNPVTVTAGGDTVAVDFVLPDAGLSLFTVTPCRIFDSRLAGPTIASGVLGGLRVESVCGIPGDAVAVSANVTVTAASGSGSLLLWGWNVTAQPATTTLSVKAGATRANNAVLALSLEGNLNLGYRAALTTGGRYHLIIDVNGYFARDAPP